MKVEEFLNPNSMLTPGIVGSMIMMITNTISYNFELPNKWIALGLSFLVGLLVIIKAMLPLWQRIIYYVLNSLVIFSMAVGTTTLGMKATASDPANSASSGYAQTSVAAVPAENKMAAAGVDCSARAAADAPCSPPR